MALSNIKPWLRAEKMHTTERKELQREEKLERERKTESRTNWLRWRKIETENRVPKPWEDRHDVTSNLLCSCPHRETLTWVQSAPLPPQSKTHTAWSCSMLNIATTHISDTSSENISALWEIGKRMLRLLSCTRSERLMLLYTKKATCTVKLHVNYNWMMLHSYK